MYNVDTKFFNILKNKNCMRTNINQLFKLYLYFYGKNIKLYTFIVKNRYLSRISFFHGLRIYILVISLSRSTFSVYTPHRCGSDGQTDWRTDHSLEITILFVSLYPAFISSNLLPFLPANFRSGYNSDIHIYILNKIYLNIIPFDPFFHFLFEISYFVIYFNINY